MFETDDVDEDYFTPSNNATLANIFSNTSNRSSDASLKYVPPKQSVSSAIQSQDGKSECLFACPLQAFEWFNNVYTPRGKVGFAIVKIMTSGHSNILLYDSHKTTLSCAIVGPSLEVKLKGETYLSFYDNAKKYWSLYGTQVEIKKIAKVLKNLNCVIGFSQLEGKGPPEHEEDQELAKEQTDDNTLKDSDTDSISNRKTKESILNRMASMGHSILPPQTTDKTSDSSDTNEAYEHHKVIRHKASKNILKKTVDKGVSDIVRLTTAQQIEPQSSISLTENQLVTAIKADVIGTVNSAQDLSQLMTEQRQNNSELRINMGRLSDKVDLLLEKVNDIHSKEKISSENSFHNNIFQKLLHEYEKKIKVYEEIIKAKSSSNEFNIITPKQCLLESEENDDEMERLKAEILRLKDCNYQKDTKIDQIQSDKEKLEVLISGEIDAIRKQSDQDKLNLIQEIESLKVELSNKEAEVVKYKNDCNISNDTRIVSGELEILDLEVRIKHIMNDTFQSIVTNFNNDENYLGSVVKTTIAAVMKEVTLETLKELNSDS